MTTVHRISEATTSLLVQSLNAAGGEAHRFVAFTQRVCGWTARHCWFGLDEWSEIQPLTHQVRQRIEKSNEQLAQDGMRVLGVALHFGWRCQPATCWSRI